MTSFIERDERCLFVGNLEERVTEEIIWELFLQAGPLEAVLIPKDKETGKLQSYGFVSFSHEVSAPYAISLMDGIPLYGKPISVKHAARNINSHSPGNQSPLSHGHGFPDDAHLRRPLFDSPSGHFNPCPPHHLTPSPHSMNGVHGNFQLGYHSPRSPWDMASPWQQDGGQGYPQRNSPQSGHQPSPLFCPPRMPNRPFRQYYSNF